MADVVPFAHPSNQWHRSLQQRVTEHLEGYGFHVSDRTYHEGRLPENVKQKLQNTFSPTALQIRSGTDGWGINPTSGLVLKFECKTVTLGGGPDLCVEALPLLEHMWQARRGVVCLYCATDYLGVDRGFWTSGTRIIREIRIPEQSHEGLEEWYWETFGRMCPRVALLRSGSRGTGDPFAVIDESVVSEMASWVELIDRFVAGT